MSKSGVLKDHKVKMRLQVKILSAVIVSLIVSSPISAFVNAILNDFYQGNLGVYVTTAVSLLVTSSIILLFVSLLIIKPLKKIIVAVNETTDGNLSTNISHHSQDEIGQLVQAINQMQSSLRSNVGQMIDGVRNVSNEVATKSNDLYIGVNEVTEGSFQLSSTIQELSSGAESQANNATQLAAFIDKLDQRIKTAYQNSEYIATASKEVVSTTENGRNLMEESVQQMKNIDQIVSHAVERVKGLDQQSKEISKLVTVIQDIAEQTNLLALNAAIEAARAGEHGQGFSVVANEVRKLAEQVRNSVGDITTIVQNIQSESSKVVESLELGYQEVGDGTKQIQTTEGTFEEINQSVLDMVSKIRGISENLKKIDKDSDQMNESIEEIASISEESAAGIEQTSASIQQSTSSLEEMGKHATQLAKMAEELNGKIGHFQI